jgi:hypothetical protein
MRKHVTTAIVFALTATAALAQTPTAKPDGGSLSDKVMQDTPGTKGGSTDNPTAKGDKGSISDKVMEDTPGTKGGTTANPTNQPSAGISTDKAIKDPGSKTPGGTN